MSERSARSNIAAAMLLVIVIAAFAEGWVQMVQNHVKSLAQPPAA